MPETKWFAKINDPSNKINKRFQVPYNTVLDWKKKQTDDSNYRGYMFDQLTLIIKLEENAIAKLKQIFKREELKALWGSLKSTMYTVDLLEIKEALVFEFQDYCAYNELEASQFTENLEILSYTVSKKLNGLVEFEKMVLLEFLRSSDGKDFIFEEKESNKD